jgi:hypothetical protein
MEVLMIQLSTLDTETLARLPVGEYFCDLDVATVRFAQDWDGSQVDQTLRYGYRVEVTDTGATIYFPPPYQRYI